MSNYFHTFEWFPTDIPCALDTESGLKFIRRVFGNTSAEESKNLLKRAEGGRINPDSSRKIKKIADECAICKHQAH